MTILAFVLSWIVFAAAGDLAGRWLAPSLRESREGRWGVALVLGPGVVAFACFLLDLLGVRLGSTLSYGLAAIVVGGVVLRGRESLTLEPRIESPTTRSEFVARAACWFVLLGCVALGVAFTLATPPYKDSIVNWSYKTLVLWRDGTVRTDDFLVADRHLYHPNYPLLVPLAQVFAYGLAGEPIDRAARAFQALPHLGIALLVLAAFLGRGSRTLALVFAALVAAIPHFYKADVQFRFAGSVPSGYADPTYAAMTTAAALGVLRWFDTRRPGDLHFAACCLALAAFTKNEAIPFTGALGVGFSIAVALTRTGRASIPNLRTILGAAAVALVIALPWFLFRSGIPERDENYQHLLTIENLVEGAWRLPLVIVFAAQSVFSFENYGVLWLVMLGMLFVRPRAWSDPGVICLTYVIVAMAGVYTSVFLVTPLPIVDSLATSIPRTFFHLSPLAVVLAGRILTFREPER